MTLCGCYKSQLTIPRVAGGHTWIPLDPLEVLGPGFRASSVWFGLGMLVFSNDLRGPAQEVAKRAASRDPAESEKCVARCPRLVRKLWSSQFETHTVYARFVGWTCFPSKTGCEVCYGRWTLIKSTWVWMAGVYLMSPNARALWESWGFCLRDLAELRSGFESRKVFFFYFFFLNIFAWGDCTFLLSSFCPLWILLSWR